MKNRKHRGFSLIELLIVVAIILIIAAIAIPNLIKAKANASEAAAVVSLKTINTTTISYSSTYGNGFPPSLAAMGTANPPSPSASCNEAQLIDSTLTSGQKSGYNFAYNGANPVNVAGPGCAAPGYNTYFITATPITVGTTGQRSFCSDQSGVTRFDPTGATPGSAAACAALTPLP